MSPGSRSRAERPRSGTGRSIASSPMIPARRRSCRGSRVDDLTDHLGRQVVGGPVERISAAESWPRHSPSRRPRGARFVRQPEHRRGVGRYPFVVSSTMVLPARPPGTGRPARRRSRSRRDRGCHERNTSARSSNHSVSSVSGASASAARAGCRSCRRIRRLREISKKRCSWGSSARGRPGRRAHERSGPSPGRG